jgi:hypothetical protein
MKLDRKWLNAEIVRTLPAEEALPTGALNHRPTPMTSDLRAVSEAAKRMICHLAARGWQVPAEGGFAVDAAGIEDEARELFGAESISGGRVVVRGERGESFMALYRRAASGTR